MLIFHLLWKLRLIQACTHSVLHSLSIILHMQEEHLTIWMKALQVYMC